MTCTNEAPPGGDVLLEPQAPLGAYGRVAITCVSKGLCHTTVSARRFAGSSTTEVCLTSPPSTTMTPSALAAHRFGFSETSLRTTEADPRGWVLAQFKPGGQTPFDGRGLGDSPAALRLTRSALTAAQSGSGPVSDGAATAAAPPASDRLALRRFFLQGLGRRWQHTIATDTPVAERWVQFWSNHCCVAATKGATLGLVWPHEQEAIRPNAFSEFHVLLRASTLHPATLLYLDNARSVGPQSRAGQRRSLGLNENLARELLELHTLGVQGGYTQTDVTETARLLTGWTLRSKEGGEVGFQATLHQPGPKTILGRRYPEGPEALDALLRDLAQHPSTARHVATKLARHFVTDDPPTALIDAVARRHMDTDGNLRQLAMALFEHPQTWRTDHPPKFKRPEELLLSAHRVLKQPMSERDVAQAAQTLQALGQPPGRAPSPQGWPDRSADWLSPDALLKRVQWAEGFAQRHAAQADARALAQLSLGPNLSASTRQQIDGAGDGTQALALWLASPDFQRR